ncbi:hypothetical protein HYFRA_00004386 [Hymenoscyphus fraxineus]|uniref:F-box domain-containing protein n=1 Tax=Hymenoscyphus fraxineus TaxID=746836 RepID=A0A9N9KVY0_9HELO|nr:hypothetical protein HYFRA_00004386 [Hymenoscyphus fraxineus]
MESANRVQPVAMPWVSGLPPEVWTMVGQQISDQATRNSLLLVCRAFRDVFTPLARDTLMFKVNDFELEKLGEKPLPPGAVNVKHLMVRMEEFCDGPNGELALEADAHRWIIHVEDFLMRLVEAMPNLRTFSYCDESIEPQSWPTHVLQQSDWFRALKGLPKLKSIDFVTNNFIESDAPGLDFSTEIILQSAGFKNLSSLQLYNLRGPESKILSDLVHTLRACPRLTLLGIGKQCRSDDFIVDSFVTLEDGIGMLENLCNQYSAGGKSDLLPLHTLRLGTFFSPYKSESNTNYLAKLVKLENLQNLHLWNGHRLDPADEDMEEEGQPTEIQWTMFDSSTITSLQITLLDDDVLEWLNDKKTVRELILIEQYQQNRPAARNLPKLRLPNLGVLHIRDDVHSRTPLYPRADQDLIPTQNPGSNRSEITTNTLIPNPSAEYSNAKILWPEMDLDAVPDPAIAQHTTILDALHDKGIELEKLAISMRFETQFWAFVRRLKNMPKLRYLRLMPGYLGRFPPPDACRWPNITSSKHLAYCYVKFLKNVCPSLQYIKIGEYTWQIVPKWSQERSLWDGLDYTFIPHDEETNIDILSYDSWAENSGLLGADRFVNMQGDEGMKEVEDTIVEALARRHIGVDDDEDVSETDSEFDSELDFDNEELAYYFGLSGESDEGDWTDESASETE